MSAVVLSSHQSNPSNPTQEDVPSKNNRQILRPLSPRRNQSQREREATLANQMLRQQIPYLSKQEATAYRYSFKHNLCLDMLQAGYHTSFRELFQLLKQQADEREEAGPDSVIWTLVQLRDQNDKLEKLKDGLTKAERAQRRGDNYEEYTARHELAVYFLGTDDKWLSEHFFKTCLNIALADKDDQGQAGQLQAEGHSNVGQRYMDKGNDVQAAYHFEESYKITVEHQDWLNRSGCRMHADACINLLNIYSSLGNSTSRNSTEEAVTYFKRAYDMAKESNDRKRIAESGYKLGLAYGNIDNSDMSLKYLREFLDQCQRNNDVSGIGKACDAIATLYRELGNIDKCVEYLRIFVGVAENSRNEELYSKACRNLGSIYNYLGNYEEATDYFGKAYNLSRSANDYQSININRVLFGISMAHNMMGRAADYISSTKPDAVANLSDWKSARSDNFVDLEDDVLEDDNANAEKSSTGNQTIHEEEEPRTSSDSQRESD